jgi:hypothetical protein
MGVGSVWRVLVTVLSRVENEWQNKLPFLRAGGRGGVEMGAVKRNFRTEISFTRSRKTKCLHRHVV